MMGPALRSIVLLASLLVSFSSDTTAQSLSFLLNATQEHDYAHQLDLPSGFGSGEFTLELWIKPDPQYPVGPVTPDTPGQLTNWADNDEEPYSGCCWWYSGNFLLDGHDNNGGEGTFSLQFYGGGRLRLLFSDADDEGPGGNFVVGAYPASNTPSLLDGRWHHVTVVRRWVLADSSQYELWIDGVLIDTETTGVRTDFTTLWNDWSTFPSGQEGWFWGVEKQAAIDVLEQYEDYKGLLDDLRFWGRAKTTQEITESYGLPVSATPNGLLAQYRFSENSGTTTCADAPSASLCMTLIRSVTGTWAAEQLLFQDGFEQGSAIRW